MAGYDSDEVPSCDKGMGKLPPCSSESVLMKRIWTVSSLFSSVMVSFEDRASEGKTGSTAASTFWLSSGMDSDGSSSMIGASADHLSGPTGFSTGEGLGRSFWYPGGSCARKIGRSSKTLLASSKKGQRWMAWSPSHSLQGNLVFPLCPVASLSLVDGVLSTWLSEVDATELCKRGDQSLSIRGMQGQS